MTWTLEDYDRLMAKAHKNSGAYKALKRGRERLLSGAADREAARAEAAERVGTVGESVPVEAAGRATTATEERDAGLMVLAQARKGLEALARRGNIPATRELREIVTLLHKIAKDDMTCMRACCRRTQAGPGRVVKVTERGGIGEFSALERAARGDGNVFVREFPPEGWK